MHYKFGANSLSIFFYGRIKIREGHSVSERLSLGDPFVTCVLREGRVLYG